MTHRSFFRAITAAVVLVFSNRMNGQSGASSAVPQLASTRAPQPPLIDGRGDDAIWRVAVKTRGFRQFSPKVDVDASFDTELQVAHDAANLYVFVRMLDPHPDSIMHALSRRDVRGPSDQIKVIVDSYGDRRSGFQFAVNPDGVKRDYSIANDSDEDESWNGVWDASTAVDSLGWTAEFRIPLSQLRFSSGESHVFGFGVWRDIERLLERSSWPVYQPNRNGLVSQLGQLTGLDGFGRTRRVEAVPYVVTRNVQEARARGFSRAQEATLGGDLKVGLLPNVTLDATVNPDFGQVEADPAVVNLTAFEPFFGERRPFFLEGTGLYQFRLNCYIVVDCSTNEGLFYSRRIGRPPALGGLYGDATTAASTPIAAAAKLTGRTNGGLAFGLLDALTSRVEGTQNRAVEPRANYLVIRGQQDLRKGEAGLGVIATAVNRSLDDVTSPYLHRAAYAAGLSARNRFSNGRYEAYAQWTASRVEGSPAAIARTQRNGVHVFQQPGDDPVLDTTRRSLSGTGGQLKFGKYGGGITRFETSLVRQSAGLDVNDVGYLRRADITDWSSWGALSFQQQGSFYRWAQVNANYSQRWNSSGTRIAHGYNMNGHIGLKNNWDLHLGGTLEGIGATYCDRCTRGGPVLRQSPAFYPWGGVNTDSRKVVSGGIWFNAPYADEGKTRSFSLSPYVNWRPSTRMQLSLSPNVSSGRDNTQWFDNFADVSGVTHYTFARLDQRTTSLTTRMNYTATPNLTLEVYAEPFVTTGRYSDVREVTARANDTRYAPRFRLFSPPPDAQMSFRYSQLRANTVARWEYRPGSTLFVVWTHGRQASGDGDERHTVMRDYRDLFALHPNNTFAVKLAYWLNR